MLASASPARLRLLLAAGFAPEVIVSGVDEDAVEAATPHELVAVLAHAKGEAVAARSEAADAIVLACDSVLDVDGVAEGKPRDLDDARRRLQARRNRSAVLRTGHHLVDVRTGRRASGVAATEVVFGDYDDDELEAYLATGEPLGVAGSFTLDGRSGPFVERIVGDHGNVIGLSMPLLRGLLRDVGIRVTDLWT